MFYLNVLIATISTEICWRVVLIYLALSRKLWTTQLNVNMHMR